MPDAILSLPAKIRLLVEWSPALQILPAIAAATPGQPRAIEVMRLLEFLASKSELQLDDKIAHLLKEILLTKPGTELADYIAGLISGAIEYELARYPGE
jgi:hypothetical protein